MKFLKIGIMAFVFSLFVFSCNVNAANGVNGYPYGWNPEFQETWTKIKDDPNQKPAWERLPGSWKWVVTKDTQYLSVNGVFNSVVQGYCGTAYKPTGCVVLSGKDKIRSTFGGMVLNYILLKDLMTPEERANAVDVLVTVTKQNTAGSGQISTSDTDNTHHAWISHTILATAIKDEFPVEYTTVTTNTQYLEWVKRITRLSKDMIGDYPDTAVYPLQGTNYDPGTMKNILATIKFLEDYSGITYFPDYKRKIPLVAEGMKSYFVPGFTQTVQWSDNQRIYYNYAYGNWDTIATFATLNNDPELWYMWDEIYKIEKAANRTEPFSKYATFSPFYNPYAPRATGEQWAKRRKDFNDSVRGISFKFTGYSLFDSMYYSNHWGNTGGDHNPNASDIGLCRGNGEMCEWCCDWARGYYGVNFSSALNYMTPLNAYQMTQYYVQQDYKIGANWKYTKGTRHNKGYNSKDVNGNITVQPYKEHSSEYYSGVGNVIELTTEDVFYRMKDNSDLIVYRYTLETPSGNDGVSRRCSFNNTYCFDDVPNNIREYSRIKGDKPLRMKAGQYKSPMNFYVPTKDVVFKDNTWTFYCNAIKSDSRGYIKGKNKITWTTFVKDYTMLFHINLNPVKDEFGFPIVDKDQSSLGMLGYSVKVIPNNEKFGRFKWLHAAHARGETDKDIVYKEIEGGLIAEIPGVEKVTVIFDPVFSITSDNPSPEPQPEPVPTCSSERLDLCDETNCPAYYYDGVCNKDPKPLPEPTCSLERLDLCDTVEKCQAISLYFYDNVCHVEPKPEPIPTCSAERLDLCTTETCGNVGHWYNDKCNKDPQPTQGPGCEAFGKTFKFGGTVTVDEVK